MLFDRYILSLGQNLEKKNCFSLWTMYLKQGLPLVIKSLTDINIYLNLVLIRKWIWQGIIGTFPYVYLVNSFDFSDLISQGVNKKL